MRTVAAALVLLLAACAGMEPFEPPVAGELNAGPGLFSGPRGEFVILRREGPGDGTAAGPAAEAEAPRGLTRPPPP